MKKMGIICVLFSLFSVAYAQEEGRFSFDLTTCGGSSIALSEPALTVQTWTVPVPNVAYGEEFTRIWQTKKFKDGRIISDFPEDLKSAVAAENPIEVSTTFYYDLNDDGYGDVIVESYKSGRTRVDMDKNDNSVFMNSYMVLKDHSCKNINDQFNVNPYLAKIDKP